VSCAAAKGFKQGDVVYLLNLPQLMLKDSMFAIAKGWDKFYHTKIWTKRDCLENEELTLSYLYSEWEMACPSDGSSICLGKIAVFVETDPQVQEGIES